MVNNKGTHILFAVIYHIRLFMLTVSLFYAKILSNLTYQLST